jgi:hypothetical protein
MELVPAGPWASEDDRGLFHKVLDPFPGSPAAAVLTDHLPQILAHHFIDRRMLLGSHGAGRLEQLFLDRKGHVQSSHAARVARIPCNGFRTMGQETTVELFPEMQGPRQIA